MIYFTFFETARACVVMLLFGAFFGVVKTGLNALFKAIESGAYLINSKEDKKISFSKIKIKFKADLILASVFLLPLLMKLLKSVFLQKPKMPRICSD